MQFGLRTLFLLFIVLWASLAAFGTFGVVVFLVCVLLAPVFVCYNLKPSTLILLAVLVFICVCFGDVYVAMQNGERELHRAHCCASYNLKAIGSALHQYHDLYGSFPPVCVTDGHGKRLHSWRTLILPWLHETYYCEKYYDFNKPWDNPNNRALSSRVTCFHCSASDCPLDTTSYVAIEGSGTAWRPDRGTSLADITDTLSETVLVVEMLNTNIGWMEPRDIDSEYACGGLNGMATVPTSNHWQFGEYFVRRVNLAGHVLMADGSVQRLNSRLSSSEMAALLSIKGNERIDLRALQATLPVNPCRWDHIFGLPMFLATVTWFWIRCISDAGIKRGLDS